MRLSTIFVPPALMLASMTTTLAVESENMLVARFADFDFLAPVVARAYDEGPELYVRGVARRSYFVPYDDELVARGNIVSNDGSRGGDEERKYGRLPKYQIAKDDSSPQYELTRLRDKNWSAETSSSRNHNRSNGKSGHHHSLSGPPLHELTRRRNYHPPSTRVANPPNRARVNGARSGNNVPHNGNSVPHNNNNVPYNGNSVYNSNAVPRVAQWTSFRPPADRYIL